MKNYITKLTVLVVAAFFSLALNAQTDTLFAPVEDGYVSDPAVITTNNPYLWNEMKLGKSAVDGSGNTTSCIIPFQLPAIVDGQEIDSISLNVYVSYGREWLNSNVSVYGLSFADGSEDGPGRAISADDHFSGAYGDGTGNGSDIGVIDSFFTKNVPLGTLDIARWESTGERASDALKAYINGQITAGAKEGDWIFIRLSIANQEMTGAQYFKIDGGDMDNPASIFIKYKTVSAIQNPLANTVSIYPNPVVGNSLQINAGELNINRVEFVNIAGQVAKAFSLNASNTTINDLNLSKGMYLVKMYGAEELAVQKIIIK